VFGLSPVQADESDWQRNVGTEADWCWLIYDNLDEVDEVNIVQSGIECDSWDETINDDGYDGYGYFTNETSFTRTIQNNWVEWSAQADSPATLTIDGNFGCDSNCVFVTRDGLFITYQGVSSDTGEQPRWDPIFVWDTNGTITYEDGDDNPYVTLEGTSLRLRHYVYGFINDQALSVDEFLDLFAAFVRENPERMDIFTTSYSAGKDRAFWSAVESCRLNMAAAISAGSDVSIAAYQSCFFTGVNPSNLASVNTQLQALVTAAAKSGTPMTSNDVIRAAGVIADRLDLVQRLSTGKWVYAAEFEPLGLTIGTKTLGALKAQSADQIDTWEEVVALAARL
jgi:hypothetical protein